MGGPIFDCKVVLYFKLAYTMCLYQIKLRNPHYLVNEKNGGHIPKPTDKRVEFINTNCGWCTECRKEIANNWRIRLREEWVARKTQVQFVTFSFSRENIIELEREMINKKYRGIEAGEIDVNLLAAFAVRRWSERWRKSEHYAPRHWLITELGHKNSERLHLHGLVFTNNKELIEKTWKYGNIWIGNYVNEKTFNYITKYITKVDTHHKGYKQKVFVSKGIGAEYLNSPRGREHKFKGEDTKTYYMNHQGFKFKLPKYYKNKLWTDEQREILWIQAMKQNTIVIAGNELQRQNYTEEQLTKMLQGARDTNERAGFGNNKTVNRKWIITEAMKMNYNELINYDKTKMVKSVERRIIITNIPQVKHEQRIMNGKVETSRKFDWDKSEGIERTIYGYYIGNTTEAERNYNKLLEEAGRLRVSVRELRLIKKGIIKRKEELLTE